MLRPVAPDELDLLRPWTHDAHLALQHVHELRQLIETEPSQHAPHALHLPAHASLYHGLNDSIAIERSPLVYALKVGAEWKKIKDNPQFADWEVYPTTPWNYALAIDREQPSRSVTFEERPLGSPPFSGESPPLIARAKGRRLPGWGIEKGAAAPPPKSPVRTTEPLEELTLVPYGCTDLRITEFPTLDEKP